MFLVTKADSPVPTHKVTFMNPYFPLSCNLPISPTAEIIRSDSFSLALPHTALYKERPCLLLSTARRWSGGHLFIRMPPVLPRKPCPWRRGSPEVPPLAKKPLVINSRYGSETWIPSGIQAPVDVSTPGIYRQH